MTRNMLSARGGWWHAIYSSWSDLSTDFWSRLHPGISNNCSQYPHPLQDLELGTLELLRNCKGWKKGRQAKQKMVWALWSWRRSPWKRGVSTCQSQHR